MHYIGMLAFRLALPVYYHLPTVLLSLISAICGSAVALYVVSRDRMTPIHVILGGLLMGAAIAIMHYTGMAAMRLQAMHHYDAHLCALSVALAMVISAVGVLLIFRSREEDSGWKRKNATALMIGLAIPIMHYTGMAAVTFMPSAIPPDLSNSVNISTLATSAILVVTFVVLGFTVLTALIDRRLSSQQIVLENERKMLRALIDNMPDFMYVKDVQGRFVIANPYLAQKVGAKKPQDLLGKTDLDFFPPEVARGSYEDEQQMMRSGEALFNREETFCDWHGQLTPILTTKVPLRGSRGEIIGIAGVGRDISERKRNEEAVRLAEKKYREMFDGALVGIFRVSADGKLLSVNPAMARFLGYGSPADMLSRLTEPLWSLAVSADRHREFEELIAKCGQVTSFELEVSKLDGSRIWISSSVRATFDDGKVTGFEGMLEDITERQLLRDQLLQAQKLEAVGQLAAGIAHEINTPIQYIGDNVRFLQDTFKDLTSLLQAYTDLVNEVPADVLPIGSIERVNEASGRADLGYLLEEIPNAIEQTLDGISRVSTLVSAMKEFSHPGTKEKTPLDLNHAIESTITVSRNEWKYVADLETRFDATLPSISCYPGEFNQVILNLIVNAAHAIADLPEVQGGQKGKILVETRDCPDGVEIRIGDSGCGIPPHARPRIFDPFFTTKEIGRGTGQGLAIAHSVIVGKHQGTIKFETEEGQGTTFIIRLPHDSRSAYGREMAL
jgi:PAS domain S-box-containing protein